MSAAIAGSEVAMTVESMFSMNRATATTSGMMRCASIALEQVHLSRDYHQATRSVYPSPACSRTRVYPSWATLDRPKSDISDFGWRDREGACNELEECNPIHAHMLYPLPT